jgi:multidrug efflux pump subunit AcrA (membrane-fusion protein)
MPKNSGLGKDRPSRRSNHTAYFGATTLCDALSFGYIRAQSGVSRRSDDEDCYLEPRQVETGDQESDRIEIRKGLRAGERIVTSAAFLIDSESQMQSAASGMTGHQHGGAALSGGDKHD